MADDPVRLLEDEETGDRFLLYVSGGGVNVELRYEGEMLWLSQAQMADLFGVTVPTINLHLKNIYAEQELEENGTIRNFLIVRTEGRRRVERELKHYSLDAIISVGYRVGSKQGTLFRRWATDKLVQFAAKGWVVDAQRLKNPAEHDRFTELRELIQDIRASEAQVYAELKRILSMCADYDSNSRDSAAFFASFQNKLHYAVAAHTAAEIVHDRADAARPNMGLTSWAKDEIRQSDVTVAKNYLGQPEIDDLNRATNMLLDYFDDQTERRKLVVLADAQAKLDEWLKFNERPVLRGRGRISHEAATAHAKSEYRKFDEARRLARKVEADANMVRALDQQLKQSPKPKTRRAKKPS